MAACAQQRPDALHCLRCAWPRRPAPPSDRRTIWQAAGWVAQLVEEGVPHCIQRGAALRGAVHQQLADQVHCVRRHALGEHLGPGVRLDLRGAQGVSNVSRRVRQRGARDGRHRHTRQHAACRCRHSPAATHSHSLHLRELELCVVGVHGVDLLPRRRAQHLWRRHKRQRAVSLLAVACPAANLRCPLAAPAHPPCSTPAMPPRAP